MPTRYQLPTIGVGSVPKIRSQLRGGENRALSVRLENPSRVGQTKTGDHPGPGRLSRNIGSTLRELRSTLEMMAQDGEIKFYQKSRRMKPGAFRGPYTTKLQISFRNELIGGDYNN